jgi:arylsulfatase A-like enzyme
MTCKFQFALILAAATCISFALPFAVHAQPKPAPNIVFFLVDDLGWTDVGCFGSSFYETPHIDKLAKSGMRFTNAYTACPVCSPTRASIMTGKHPVRVNITDWIPGQKQQKNARLIMPEDLDHLPLAEVTLEEMLRAAC